MQTLEGEARALRAIQAYRDPRYLKLDLLERYVETTQYDGRSNWYDDSQPLWERAPCIAYPIVQAGIASNVDMLLGEQSFPAVSAFSHVNDDEELEDEKLAEAIEWIDRGIGEVIEKARLKAAAREAYAHAQGSRTAVSVFGLRNGRPFVDSLKAKWCTRDLDADGNVTRLTVKYAYLDKVKDERTGNWLAVAKLYKRVIDAKRDVTFVDVEAREDGLDPKDWPEDSALTFEHGFGFCPVIWYAYRKGCTAVNEIDGRAIHEHCLDEILAHDFAISQRHTAALFVGQPQICEFGVPPGYNPTEEGRTPDLLATEAGGMLPEGAAQLGDRRITGRWVTGKEQTGARKKGPGHVWQYPDKQTCDVKMLELSSGALEALDNHARDLRTKIAESLQVVFLDPEHVKFAATVSGKALRTLRERQYAHCDQDREDFGDGWLVPAVRMILRIVSKVGVAKVKLRFAPQLFKALKQFAGAKTETGEDGDTEARGDTVDEFDIPDLDLKWPDHFMPGAQDELYTVQAVAAAKDDIPQKYRLQKLARIFDIQNIDTVLEEMNEEKAERQAQAMNQMAAEADHLHAIANGDRKGAKPGKPAAGAPPGSGNAPAPAPGAA